MTETPNTQPGAKAGRFLGSLKDALVAAGRDDIHGEAKTKAAPDSVTGPITRPDEPTKKTAPAAVEQTAKEAGPVTMSAAEAARLVKAQTSLKTRDKHVEFNTPPTTRVVRGGGKTQGGPARTQLVRGKAKVERGEFDQDPVVGWLVVVGGPGIGAHRPIYEGNNTVGRSTSQRVPIDFGDDSISSEEQAYIRYDSASRSFLFVPNLAKTNVVSINDQRPTGAVALNQMDVITMGRTQLVFVPFCGSEFDWAELTDAKG